MQGLGFESYSSWGVYGLYSLFKFGFIMFYMAGMRVLALPGLYYATNRFVKIKQSILTGFAVTFMCTCTVLNPHGPSLYQSQQIQLSEADENGHDVLFFRQVPTAILQFNTPRTVSLWGVPVHGRAV